MSEGSNRRPISGGGVWRAIRTPLSLLVLLGILGFGGWWGYNNVMKAPPPPPPTPCTSQDVDGSLRASQVAIRVFNGGAATGKAGEVSRVLVGKGFAVRATTNTDERVKQTTIVGKSKNDPAVKLVQSFFKKTSVREDKRVDGTVDVIVGSAYAGMNTNAKTSIKIKGKTACIPASTASN